MPFFKKVKMMMGMLTGREMLTCEQVLEQLFDYLDGELSDHDETQVRDHLEMCKQCYPRAEFEKAFLDALHKVKAGEATPDSVRENVLAAIRDDPQPVR